MNEKSLGLVDRFETVCVCQSALSVFKQPTAAMVIVAVLEEIHSLYDRRVLAREYRIGPSSVFVVKRSRYAILKFA